MIFASFSTGKTEMIKLFHRCRLLTPDADVLPAVVAAAETAVTGVTLFFKHKQIWWLKTTIIILNR